MGVSLAGNCGWAMPVDALINRRAGQRGLYASLYVRCKSSPAQICRLAVAGDGGGTINVEGLRMAG
nr:MAG TPA: hypothetical protein [Caudoviricetes sp.]